MGIIDLHASIIHYYGVCVDFVGFWEIIQYRVNTCACFGVGVDPYLTFVDFVLVKSVYLPPKRPQ